jgi:2-oxo-4-hydroxy-4-carboxy-5-ureidoimidazoline decarboxylase
VEVAEFDALDAAAAGALLRPCCTSRRWITSLVAGRPYRSLPHLVAASDAALTGLDWPDIAEALDAHPRIGERVGGSEREAAWSRAEQSGAAGHADELIEGNRAYEARFGHVFLICASGRSAAEILAALRERLGNSPETERAVVRTELRDIVRLRLAKTFR